MVTLSAGLLAYRRLSSSDHSPTSFEVLIAHMGGPFWQRKDAGAWTIPKGEFDPAVESALEAARREFREELGVEPPAGDPIELGSFPAARKVITVYAVDGSALDLSDLVFGEFELEWPPGSGRRARFPEVDRIAWLPPAAAAEKLTASQRPVLTALAAVLGGRAVG